MISCPGGFTRLQADVIIAGGGLAGLVTAYELLDRSSTARILLLDKDKPERLGGLAKISFGGIHMIATPHQSRLGIKDSPELAWRDWQSVAHFPEGDADRWPKAWAQFYCNNSREFIYEFLTHKKIEFLPLVNWAERGVHAPANSVPRWHITWGTGYEIISRLTAALDAHPGRKRLTIQTDTEVSAIEVNNGRATGIRGTHEGRPFEASADHIVIASGGVCGGDLSKVRANWYEPWGSPPEKLLNGSHDYADGQLHDRVSELDGAVTHLDLQWHYAAGVHHPERRRPNDGLSLVPPRSALWMNARGERILNPGPMPAYGDTRHLVESVLREPGQYSWQVLNMKIAVRELAVSGGDYMTAFRFKKRLTLLKNVFFGDRPLVDRLLRDCAEDIVVANSIDDLMDGMDQKNLYGLKINREAMTDTIRRWDAMIAAGPAYHNDEQLRRIANFRAYRGDRVRTCDFQRILDPSALPLIAIREFILTRKSLGGIQTDLAGRVLRADQSNEPIPGLYAVGEAAGFGGGGIHGRGSLEGTFLGGCVLTGRATARSIANGQ